MYQIIIRKTVQQETVTREWATIERHGDDYKYGYTPQIAAIKDKEITLFEQNIEDLDLIAVIAAINNIEYKRKEPMPE